jgi:CRISPR-associated protein Cmr5
MKSLEQEFAEKVYNRTVAFGNIHPKGHIEREQYGGMAHKLPILVRTAGLAEALAFVESRGKDGHIALLEDLAQVVYDHGRHVFLEQSRNADLQEYIYLTRRTMLALKWFKRFAQSALDVQPTAEGEITT